MMMEWDANRRADWLYHNQSRLSTEAYADARRDAAVQARLSALEAQRIAPNANYVDSEFAGDPTDQYDQSYVEAAYNPAVMPASSSTGRTLLWIFLGVMVVGFVIFVALSARWGK